MEVLQDLLLMLLLLMLPDVGVSDLQQTDG